MRGRVGMGDDLSKQSGEHLFHLPSQEDNTDNTP